MGEVSCVARVQHGGTRGKAGTTVPYGPLMDMTGDSTRVHTVLSSSGLTRR